MADETQGGRRHRSPAYPFLGLEAALGRAKALYEKERLHPAAVPVVTSHWGFQPKSSGGLQTISALRQFGLMDEAAGSGPERRVKLNDVARRLILLPRESDEWQGLAMEAAVKPTLYDEMFEKWGTELPSDQNLRTYLVVDRNFNEASVESVIRNFRDTLSFSGLSKAGTMSGPQPDIPAGVGLGSPTMESARSASQMPTRDIEPVRIALEGGGIGRVIFQGSVPTTDDIDTLIEVLKIQKRRFARSGNTESETPQ